MDTDFNPRGLRIEDAMPERKSSKLSKFASKAKSVLKKLTTPKDGPRQKYSYPCDDPGKDWKVPKLKTADSKLGYTKSDFIESPRITKTIEEGPYKMRDYCGVDDVGKVPKKKLRKPSVDPKNVEMPDFSKVKIPEMVKKVNKDYIDEDATKVPAPEVDQKKVNASLAPDTTETTATKSTAAHETKQAEFTEDEATPSVIYYSQSVPPSEAPGKRGRIVDVVIEVPNLGSEQEPEVLQMAEPPLPCPCDSVLGVLCPMCYNSKFSLFFEECDEDSDDETMDEEDSDDETLDDSMVDEEELENDEYSEDSDQSESLDSDWNTVCPKCNNELERIISQYNEDGNEYLEKQQEEMELLKESSAILQEYDEENMNIDSEDESEDESDSDEDESDSDVSDSSTDVSVSDRGEDAEAECSEDSENLECESSGVDDGEDMSDENDEEADEESEELDDEAAALDEDELEVLDKEEEDEDLDEEDEDLDEDGDVEVCLNEDGDDEDEYIDDELDILCPSCYSNLFTEALARMGFIYVGNSRPILVAGDKFSQKVAGAKTSSTGAPTAPMDTGKVVNEDVSAERTAEEKCDSSNKIIKQALTYDIDTLIKNDNVFVRQAEKMARKLFGADIVDFNVQFNFRTPNILDVLKQTAKISKEYLEASKGTDNSELPKSSGVEVSPTKTKQKLDDVGSADKGSDGLEWDYDLEWDMDADEDPTFYSYADSSFDILTDVDEDTDGASDLILEIDPTTQPKQEVDISAEDKELLTDLLSKDKMFAIKLDKLVRETYGEDSAWEFEATHQLNTEGDEQKTQAQEQEVAADEATGDTEAKRLEVEVESDHENAPQNAAAEKAPRNTEEIRLYIEVESDHDNAEQAEIGASGSCLRSECLPKLGAEAVGTKAASEKSHDSGVSSHGGAELDAGEDSHSALEPGARGQDQLGVPEGYESRSTDDTELEFDYEFDVSPPSSNYADRDHVVGELGDRNVTLPSPPWTIIVYLLPEIDDIDRYAPLADFYEERQGKEGKVNVVYSLNCPRDFRQIMHQIDPDILENLPPMEKFVLAVKALSQIVAPHRVRIVFELPPYAPTHVRACYKDIYRRLRRMRVDRYRPLEAVSNRIYDASLPLTGGSILKDVRAHCKSALVSLERVADNLEKSFELQGKEERTTQRWYAMRYMGHAMTAVAQVVEEAPLPVRVRALLQRILQKAEETMQFLWEVPTTGVEALSDLRRLSLQLLDYLAEDIPCRDWTSARQSMCMQYLTLVCDGLLRCVFYTPDRVKVRRI